jgi:putrescine transport system substrate-binding protein
LLPNVPLNSWRLIFDPAFAAKLATCGINIFDAPTEMVRLVLKYLGKNPNAPTPQDLSDAASVLLKIRPYVRNIDTSGYIEAMANGDSPMLPFSRCSQCRPFPTCTRLHGRFRGH